MKKKIFPYFLSVPSKQPGIEAVTTGNRTVIIKLYDGL